MARAEFLLDIVRSGARGDQVLWSCRAKTVSPAEANGGQVMITERSRQAEAAKLDAAIAANLKELGYGG